MNISDLQKQYNEEENDLKALGIGVKIIREERAENFCEKWLPEIQKYVHVEIDLSLGRYTFMVHFHGKVDFYPKANKVLIRKTGKWIKPGLKWIINNLDLK